MANQSGAINVQIDPIDKEQATIILKELGINMTSFVTMAIKQLIYQEGLPFEVKTRRPNKELIEALKEGEDILSGKIEKKGYHNAKEMFDDILNEN